MIDGVTLLTFFVLAVFVGFEVVSKVSSVLHTPLMSGANAIHGVILVGAIIVDRPCRVDGRRSRSAWPRWCSPPSTWSAGFVVTDRMLEMFDRRPAAGRRRDGVLDGRARP